MALLNYTTKIDADKTAQEISKCLSSHGASGILTEYSEGILSSLSFKIRLNEKELGFRLPCDWRPIAEIFKKEGRVSTRDRDAQAVRTSWRIVKDWVVAQMALVETQMVTTQDVFLPYAIMSDGRTLSEHVQKDPSFLLEVGK